MFLSIIFCYQDNLLNMNEVISKPDRGGSRNIQKYFLVFSLKKNQTWPRQLNMLLTLGAQPAAKGRI